MRHSSNFTRLQNFILICVEWLTGHLLQIQNTLQNPPHDRAASPELEAPEPSPELGVPETRGAITSSIVIPQPLKETLTVIAETRHGSLAAIPVVDGVNEVIFYLDRATHWHLRRRSPESNHASKLANAKRAYWLIQVIQEEADEYRRSIENPTFARFREEMANYGMTLSQFLSQLEEV